MMLQSASNMRGWQMDQLRKAIPTIHLILQNITAGDATTYRDGGGGWTVLEVMCHLRDYEDIFFQRAEATVEQDNPELYNPDPNALAVENKYNEQDLNAVFNQWKAMRQEQIAFLENITEADWEKQARHPHRGPVAVLDQITITVWHDMNHIDQIVKIVTEKKTGS